MISSVLAKRDAKVVSGEKKPYTEIILMSLFILLFCHNAHKTFVGGFMGKLKVLILQFDHFQ